MALGAKAYSATNYGFVAAFLAGVLFVFSAVADEEAGGSAANTKLAAAKLPTSQQTQKKRSVPAAAFGLLRRKDLHLYNFFQRHNPKNSSSINREQQKTPQNPKNLLVSTSNINAPSSTKNSTIFNCAISGASPRESRANTPISTNFSCATAATTSMQQSEGISTKPVNRSVNNSSNSNSDEEDNISQQQILPLVSSLPSNSRFAQRSGRRLIAAPLSLSGSGPIGRNSGQIPSSSSGGGGIGGHHHLAASGGPGQLHARRESFLYRADDREPFFNPASLLGYRPVSRASSVASSDPQ